MKSKLLLVIIIIAFIIGGFFSYKNFKNTIESNHRTAIGVITHKVQTTKDFIVIIKENNGVSFDIKTTPTMYMINQVGDTVTVPDIRLNKLGEPEQFGEFFWIFAILLCILGIVITLIISTE